MPYSESNNMAQWTGKLKYRALLEAKTVLMPMYDNWDSWLSDYSCLYRVLRENWKGEWVIAVVVFRWMRWQLSKFGSQGSGLLARSSSGQEEIQSIHLLDLHVAACTIHRASVSVTMVTLSTVYFLILTHNSVPSTWGKCNLKFLRHTGVVLRNLTSSASMTTAMDGPPP